MKDPIEWLGEWEPIECIGKHSQIVPARFAHGYQWKGIQCIDKRPKFPTGDPLRHKVQRAIPVGGTVTAPPPSWRNSPQARFWLDEPKQSLWKRFQAWLRR